MKDGHTDMFARGAAAAHLVQPEVGAITEVVSIRKRGRGCGRARGAGHRCGICAMGGCRGKNALAVACHCGTAALRLIGRSNLDPGMQLTSRRTVTLRYLRYLISIT